MGKAAEKSKVDSAKRRIVRHHAHAIQTSEKQKRGAKCASYVFTLCHTAEWYSRFTRVIFALRRVVLLRSGIREMCERYSRISYGRYSRTSCECRAAEGGTAEWYSRFTRVIFALRRVVLLRSGIREMCERYSRMYYGRYSRISYGSYLRTSCECRAAEGGLAEIMLFLSSFIKVIRNCHIQRRPKKHTVLFLPPFSPLPYIVRRRGKKQRLCI